MQKPQETTNIVKGEQVKLSDLKTSHDNVVVAAPGPGGQGVEGRHALRPELGIFPILVYMALFASTQQSSDMDTVSVLVVSCCF